ncbi:MAG: hypothetical protein FWC62_06215 [Firmicutes bacterium]|nr:hypothetical protein [Bacillota bacterium]
MTVTGEVLFKGAKALFLENEQWKAIITLRGSKLVSLLDKTSGRELLLQSKGDQLLQGGYDADYNAVDVGGFDEMFPTIDACFYESAPWEGARLPDHGEVWSLDWDCAAEWDCIHAQVHGVRLPYTLTKRIHFTSEADLRIDYTLENLSPFDLDFVWAAHAMFAMEENSAVLLPDGCESGTLAFSHGELLGTFGDSVELQSVLQIDRPHERYMDKFYIDGDLPSGWCGVFHPSDHSAYRLSFPVETVPYLGVLLSRGLHLGNCAILEPCTGAFDRPDRAKAFGKNSVLKAMSSYTWYLEFSK